MKSGSMSVTIFLSISYLLLLKTSNCSGSSRYYITIDKNITASEISLCSSKNGVCWVILAIGVAITVLLLALITCIGVVICLAVKGYRYLVKRNPFSVVPTGQSDTEQNRNNQPPPQNQRIQEQQPVGHAHTDPQYATVDSESDVPVAHYFELEKPEETAARLGTSLSTIPSQQENEAKKQQLPVTYDELTGPGHNKTINSYPKVSEVSLPPSSIQYSSIEKVNSPAEAEADEPIPIYSMPDKSKKKKAKEEAEIKKSRSISIDSYGGGILGGEPEKTPSPPPPLLPPKPGQAGGESLYSEASSKPMRKANTLSRRAPELPPHDGGSHSRVAMGTVGSPHGQSTNEFHSHEDLPRSFSLMDYAKITQMSPPTSTEQRPLYDMPLDVFLNYGDGGQRMTDKTGTRL